ncbi:MAG: hypothetical protein SFX72_06115 [Isosphaeraceae bacterium]|nr:hypothetical protein [Isosphaeraceae bacterium]
MPETWKTILEVLKRFFVDDVWGVFINGFLLTMTLPVVAALLAGLLFNVIGRGLGLPLLLWVDGTPNERRRGQFLVGLGIGVLLIQIVLAGYIGEEFATNYTVDRSPFCEVRVDPPELGIPLDGEYSRFRYVPSSMVTVARYAFSLALAVVAIFVVARIFVWVVSRFGGYAPFSKPWKPYRGHDVESPTTVLGVISRAAVGLAAEGPVDRPKPVRTWYLPLGIVVGLLLVGGLGEILLSKNAAIPLPGSKKLSLHTVGWWMAEDLGGWGLAVARGAKVSEAKRLIDEEILRAASEGRPPSPSELEAIIRNARGVGEQAAGRDRAEYLASLSPYFAVYGLFLTTFLGVLAYTALMAGFRERFRILTPAGWLLFFMNAAVFLAVFASYFVPFSLNLLVVVVVALIVLAGRTYKLRFPNLEPGDEPVSLPAAYARAAHLEAAEARGESVDRSPAHLILASELKRPSAPDGVRRKAPIAIICASGGGSRACYWTMNVLAELERSFLAIDRDKGGPIALPYHTRLVTGASGGMLGASAYVAALEAPSGPISGGDDVSVRRMDLGQGDSLRRLIEASGMDFLDDTVHALGYRDLWNLFTPSRYEGDRGWAIEESWRRAFGGALDRTFSDLRAGELEGWRPSLIFSPMLVEDGRQLFISNLALQSVTRNEAHILGSPPIPGHSGRGLLSREGVHFFDLFPSARERFQVGTAARMSASFPFVLPAAILPTNPPRRVVDAGYYDNYGVGIAGSWLANHIDWVRENASGVVVIQIRDGASEASRKRERVDDAFPPIHARGLQWLTSPPEGLWAARTASNSFRNDSMLHLLTKLYEGAGFADDFLAIATFELSRGGDVSLSWKLSENERSWVREELGRPDFTHPRDALRDWWLQRI